MLDQLSRLAEETSSDKRRELMRTIADLFVVDAALYNDRELILFGKVLTELLDSVDVEAKVGLSESVALVENTPRDLVMTLASQEIEIATPILEHSPVLTDEDLVEIVSTKTTDHRLAIAHRDNLNVEVTDALISKGEQPVLQSVTRNVTAKISDTGFYVLADTAENDEETRDALSQRADMSSEIVERVMPLLPQAAQAQLKELYANTDSAARSKLIEEARQRVKEAADQRKWKQIQSRVLLQEIRDGKKELDAVIEGFSNTDRLLDIAFLIAGVTGLPEKQILSALMNKNSKAIVVLCRALDFTEETFGAIIDMRGKRFMSTAEAIAKTIQDFAELEPAAAKRTMRFVKTRAVVNQ